VYEVPGFKFGRYHHRGEVGTPADLLREPDADDELLLRTFGERYFPAGSGATMALRACMFTNTPDEHFILDHHPEYPQVVLASPCSGHGYKFCSVIGEILADLATGDGTTRHDIGFLRLSRPGLSCTSSRCS
jgi:sarcosine oxidase